jgi:capsular polysaccharide biosynthesis protein
VSDHYSGYLPRPVSDFLREKIWTGYKVGEAKQPERKIYISRSKATKRRILNEEELLPTTGKVRV